METDEGRRMRDARRERGQPPCRLRRLLTDDDSEKRATRAPLFCPAWKHRRPPLEGSYPEISSRERVRHCGGNTAHGDLEERVRAPRRLIARTAPNGSCAALGGWRRETPRAEQSQKRRVSALTSAAAGERRTSGDSARR
ncbi:hypothetical protein HPB47_027470 [Ixodes persulcatus]|uniref:Uncharacterized protein n=1 Tax=Ixodes persulcatus TaxID=34615 RepID=A0AC60PXC4_IXOPE|nr:hypothetical protein HPB47_027470 [Ixodes persulcatus]